MDAQLSFEDIDPTLARAYLAKNIDNNRNPMVDRISRMVRDMLSGDWISTADPIKFNADDKLIDGQHRLRAIIESKTTQRFLVARDLDENAVYVIDTGATRTAAQALKIATGGEMHSAATVVAIAQVVHAYDSGILVHAASNFSTKDRMTNAEAIEYIGLNKEALEIAQRMAAWVRKNAPLPESVLGAAYFILARIDAEAASMFFGRIREGSAGFTVSDPVTTLTRRLYQDKINQRRVSPALALYYILRSWNAWREEEQLSKLQAGSVNGHSLIPTPK